jgi:hypothetical protein
MTDCAILAIVIIIAALIISDSGTPRQRGGYGVYRPKAPPAPPPGAPPPPVKTR